MEARLEANAKIFIIQIYLTLYIYELACFQELTKTLNSSNLDQPNQVTDNDELWKFLYMNIVPILQKSFQPCPDNDPNCNLPDELQFEPPIVNRKEDHDAYVDDLITAESTSPLLHQAVATAVSDGAVVSDH